VSKFVRPGAQRIGVTSSFGPLQAFARTNLGQLAIVGVNTSTSPATLTVTLTNLPSFTNLELFYTDSTANLYDAGPIAVGNGTFQVTAPADSIFTVANTNTTVQTNTNVPPPPPPTGSNWVQVLQIHLTAWKDGGPLSFPITTRTIINSLSGLATNGSGAPVTFSPEAFLVRKQFLGYTNDADVRYAVRQGKPPVDTDVSGFLAHSEAAGVTNALPGHMTGHELETYSLANDPTLSFAVQGFGASVYLNLRKSTNQVLQSRTVDVSGTGLVPAQSTNLLILHGTVMVTGGKLE
jgi:hypothetical protein